MPRICSFIKHVGHQCDNQWYINEEVHEIFNDLLNIIALFCVKRHLTQLVASVTKILLNGTVNFYFLLVQCVLFITMSCFSTKYCFPHGGPTQIFRYVFRLSFICFWYVHHYYVCFWYYIPKMDFWCIPGEYKKYTKSVF